MWQESQAGLPGGLRILLRWALHLPPLMGIGSLWKWRSLVNELAYDSEQAKIIRRLVFAWQRLLETDTAAPSLECCRDFIARRIRQPGVNRVLYGSDGNGQPCSA